jgi:hypothetical protein
MEKEKKKNFRKIKICKLIEKMPSLFCNKNKQKKNKIKKKNKKIHNKNKIE